MNEQMNRLSQRLCLKDVLILRSYSSSLCLIGVKAKYFTPLIRALVPSDLNTRQRTHR